MTNLFSLPRGKRSCCALFKTVLVCVDHVKSLVMWTQRNMRNPLYFSPVDVNGGVLSPPFPVVHDLLLYLTDVEGEVGVLVQHQQVSDLLPIGCD
jgi:hypothetical protein